MHKFLFISNVLPGDDLNPDINTQKATYLAQKGIMDALSQKVESLQVLSYPQYPVYPNSKIIYKKSYSRIEGNTEYVQIPTINLPVLRIVFRNFFFLVYILNWCIRNRKTNKHVIQYNVSSPSLIVTLAAKLFKNTDVSAFLYDLGMPPSSYNYSWFKRLIYIIIDVQAKALINKMDYAYVITRAVAEDYASKIQTLLVDGGISEDVLSHIPLKDNRNKDKTICLIAGNLTETNGVKLLLDASKYLKEENVEFWFAGKGDLVDLIKQESLSNPQILYKGFFDTRQLFETYASVDILLNLRLMPGEEGRYLFPSKLLEYLITGRRVISTDFAHVKEVYGDICDVLTSATAENLAEILKRIIADKDDKKGALAQNFMLRNRTWLAQISTIVDMLVKGGK